MTLTLNQIIQRLETLALSHKQIKSFFVGDVADLLSYKDVEYPLCYVNVDAGQVSTSEKKTTFNFKVYFLDLLNVSDKALQNEWELKSDLTSIAQDYIAMVNYSGYSKDWQTDVNYNLQIKTYDMNDVCVGVQVDIAVKTLFANNRCQVPATGITFESPQSSIGVPYWYDAKYVGNYLYKANGTEGNTITIGSLKNRQILMVFQGDKLLEDTQYTYNSSTGQFTFTYDLENEQVIQILTRNII